MDKLSKFYELGLSENIMKALLLKGFEIPSPIQEASIPIILNSEYNLIGQAQTGTGKTAAFGLPIIDLIPEKSKHVQAIILSPTRELAIQISDELNTYKGSKKIHIMPIYGGQSIDQQLRKLSSGVDIVVGTPGRVLDHLRRQSLKLDAIKYLVLDEADEMLNMGFIDEVEEIMKVTNPDKRTFMFCATMPAEILDLSKKHMKDYKLIKIEKEQLTTDLTDQIYYEVEESDKLEALCRIIDFEKEFYGLVFCRTKLDVDTITNKLIDRGYDADGLHGDISQNQREKVLNRFRSKKLNILVATDVAARGIDIHNLTHVINYSLPQDAESYVHRVGRTGRAGNEGTAITFVTRKESRGLMYLKKSSKTDIRKGKVPGVKEIINSKISWLKNEILSLNEEKIEKVYTSFAKDLLEENDATAVLASVLKMAYSNELDSSNYKEISEVKPDIKGHTRLFIAMGKKDGMSKKSIVQLIKDKAKTHDKKINDVQVFDTYSFITVPFQESEFILRAFKKDRIGKRPIVEKAAEHKN